MTAPHRYSRREWLLGAAGAVPLLAAFGCAARRRDVPPFDSYLHLRQPRSTSGAITVTFFGTTSLLLQQGTTNVIADGFASRPDDKQVFTGKIEPDERRIRQALQCLGIDRAEAIFAGHSHYDHAMDAPLLARITNATLLGSESTLNIGRGLALPESQMRQVVDGETVWCKALDRIFVESAHSRGDLAPAGSVRRSRRRRGSGSGGPARPGRCSCAIARARC